MGLTRLINGTSWVVSLLEVLVMSRKSSPTKENKDTLGWPLLTDVEKAILVEHGYVVLFSAIGTEIAGEDKRDRRGNLVSMFSTAHYVLDKVLEPQGGDPIFRAMPREE